jgi:hypothetical protein
LVVVDCAVYSQLNKLTGRIHSFKKQNGQYIAAVNTLKYSSPSFQSSVFMQLCPQYMEPLHKVTKFEINISRSHQRNEEIVSIPNSLCGSEPTTQLITIKFYWQVFEGMRKEFIRPEMTSTNLSAEALCIELSRINNHALVKNQRDVGDK